MANQQRRRVVTGKPEDTTEDESVVNLVQADGESAEDFAARVAEAEAAADADNAASDAQAAAEAEAKAKVEAEAEEAKAAADAVAAAKASEDAKVAAFMAQRAADEAEAIRATKSSAAKIEAEKLAAKDLVTVVIPKSFNLMLDTHEVVRYVDGVQEMPRSHAEHWYSKVNGVRIYTKK